MNGFQKKALESGELGSLLRAVSKVFSTLLLISEDQEKNAQTKHKLKFPAHLTKTQINYLSNRPEGSLNSLNFLRAIGIEIDPEENYRKILAFSGVEDYPVFNNLAGAGYLGGKEYSPGVCKLKVNQPINDSNSYLIDSIKGVGISYIVEEHILLPIPSIEVEPINLTNIENLDICVLITETHCLSLSTAEWRVNNFDRFNNSDKID